MKYVYIVTRDIRDELKGCHSVPNLGVFSNKEKATKHYYSCIEDRKKRDSKVTQIFRNNDDVDIRKIILEYYIERKDGSKERLVIEQWPLN